MILTTGIQNAPVVSRLELRTFLQDKDVTNLYVLATDQMMRIPQDDLSSWFQIAAIHGRPYIPYDGVGVKGSFGGYCTHSSILFPSWHRPYLALFEQSLSKHVHEIAAEYKNPADKERYLKAAKRFRIPYWDWATDPALPDIVATEETIDVHLPDGTKGNIRNPLFGYYFNPVYSDFGDGLPDEKIWEAWQATYRYPTTTDSKAKSVPSLMQSTLRNNRLTLHDRTYNIITQLTDYVVFSHDASTGNDQDPAGFDSIESIHNQIHGLAGRNGHMGVVDYAAFDPVFWMHHANVDRLFAIWQGLHPDAYVTPLKSEAGTFTRKPGEIENVESPLTPFRRTAEKFWNSAEVRNTHVFNYTYPELEGLDSLSKEEKIIRLRQAVNRLYAPTHSAPKPVPTLPTGPTPAGGAHPTPAAPDAHKPTEHGHAPAPEAHKPTEHGHAPAPEAHKPTEHGHASTQHGHETAQHGHATEHGHGPTHHERATAQHGRAPTQHGRAPTQHGHDIIGHALGATQLAHEIISTANDGAQAIITATNPGHVRIATATNPGHVLASTAKDNVDEHHHEWIANIAVEKYAAKSSFFVHLFLGDIDDDHTKWGTHPNLVGSHVIFANNANFTGCEKCRDAHEKKKVVTGTIPLTRSLVARLGGIQHLHPEKVAPFLQKNLHWRVQKHDNTPIDVKQLPSLKVSVGHSIVQIAKIAEHFASWNGIQLHDSVTSGRPGGA